MAPKPKYKKEYTDEIIDKMAQGLFDEEICADWSISRNCFYQWLKKYPDFKEAYEVGFNKCFLWWMGAGRAKFAAERDGGFKYWQNVMTNKFHWNGKAYLNGDTQININNMNVLQTKSPEEYLEQIKDNLQELDFLDVKVTESTGQKPLGIEADGRGDDSTSRGQEVS